MKSKNTIYELNIASLKKYHPDLLKIINDPEIKPLGELKELESGAKNLKVPVTNGVDIFLHGQTGPSEDAAQFLDIIPQTASGVIIIMGFGLGVPSLEILKNRPNIRHLFIFESNLGIFKQAVNAYDLSDLFSDSRVTFCLDEEPEFYSVFLTASKALELEDIQILRHAPSFKINPAYTKLSEKIFEYMNTFSIRGATTKTLGKKFTQNRFQNLKRFRHDVLVDSIQNIFKNIPAVLVAGGPSLDKNIGQLKKLKGKAILFAVDTVVPKLLKNGIVPEFIASIDPQHITLEKYKGADIPKKGVTLICSAWVTPRVPFHVPVERVIWTFGGRAIEQWFNNSIGGRINYIGAGTVAHLNLNVALDLGCSPIIFVGQDLAYSEEKDHASDVSLKNVNQMEEVLNSKSNWMWVKGFYGDKVKTSRSFLDNKKVFEAIIKAKNTIEFINSTEGGAHIEGTKPMKLIDVIDTTVFNDIEPEKTISQNAVTLGGEKVSALDKQLEELIGMGNNILKHIKMMTTICLETKKSIQRLKKKSTLIKDFSALPQNLQKKITKIDSLSAKLDRQGLFWHLLDEVTFEGLRQSEKMLFDIGVQAKETDRYLDWLQKNIERMEYINKVRKEIIAWLNDDVSSVLAFHKKEESIIVSMQNKNPSIQKIRSLCKFYNDQGLTALAMKYIEKIDNPSGDADLLFIQGCSSSYCGDKEKAERYFEKAISLNLDIKNKITDFKMERAEEYFKFGKKWLHIDSGTSRNLFIDGLRYNKHHAGILKALIKLLDSDLKKISSLIKENKHSSAQEKASSWLNEIEKRQVVQDYIPKEKIAGLYRLAGEISVKKKAYSYAYKMYANAIECAPDIPEHYIQLTDLCFSLADYDNGVKSLNKAVELDRSNAKYWELIGDQMVRAGSMNDALSAYEKCFLVMPEKIHLLLKMGDVYMAMGQTEAAQEAKQQHQKLLNSNPSSS